MVRRGVVVRPAQKAHATIDEAEDVQDVGLEQSIPARVRIEEKALQPEQMREAEDLPASLLQGPGCRTPVDAPIHSGGNGERNRHTREKQEKRRGEAADGADDHPDEPLPLGARQRPRVQRVPLDHREDRDSAEPVDVPEARHAPTRECGESP